MNIAHIAIWVNDLEAMRDFYSRYFEGKSNEKYINPLKGFESYFISFESGAKLELMRKQSINNPLDTGERLGITHIAFRLGSKEAVLSLTETLRSDGFRVVGEPRLTGDGYFESVVLDIEGNRIELLA
ncbi:MAG: glyoxalase/bleomycin resistance/extradiol dioxygenase family protein [Bacteroidales bacterium]|nr:glyoxalase/bleomycin resistance/extradiol dioxygenase family protein [Bacteroidales bacterium]